MNNELHLLDLIDIDVLQKIQDGFADMTGLAALTTDADGIAVTKGSNFTDFCTKYTRNTVLGCKRCGKCDKNGAELALRKGMSSTYFCHAGLVDFAAPIMANGTIVGSFIGGQVLAEAPDLDKFAAVAEELGIEPEKYIEAVKKVPIMEKKNIDKAARFLYTIANVLSNIAYNKHLLYLGNIEIEKTSQMKSDFLANMSHEIRTPMNAVLGMAEMALREELPPKAREYIHQIKSSSKTLLTIINDILDFSKIESGKMDIIKVKYNPLSIVNDIVNIIVTRIGKKDVEFTLDISPDIPNELFGDNVRINQIILNIMNNAVKFTPHGQVHLKIYSVPLSENTIELRCSVSDTGIGIKKEDLSKLFKSFQQVDSKRNRNIEGTGLGLAISKQLLKLMDGSIHVDSEYGKGSTFSFELPQKVEDASPSIPKLPCSVTAGLLVFSPYVIKQLKVDLERFGVQYSEINSEKEISGTEMNFLFIEFPLFSSTVERFLSENPSVTGIIITSINETVNCTLPNLKTLSKPVYSLNLYSAITNKELYEINDNRSNTFSAFTAPSANILIVDDNEINLTVACGLLEPLQMNIDTATSGKEAISKISQKSYDLIFMDHMMPEIDGIETTHIIRRFYPDYNVPIIALTANAIDGAKGLFQSEGMNDFVSKPIETKVIVQKLLQWLPADKICKSTDGSFLNSSENAETSSQIVIEGLDTKAALALLGSEKLFWSVLGDYYRVIDKKVKLISEYEQSEKIKEYTIEVHALKSASRQIGASELATKAELLEAAGNAGDLSSIHSFTDELLKQYLSYKSILEPYFQQSESSAGTLEFTDKIRDELFAELREAMDNLDSDTMDETIKKFSKYCFKEKEAELFQALKNAVDDIDTDECENIIEMWLANN